MTPQTSSAPSVHPRLVKLPGPMPHEFVFLRARDKEVISSIPAIRPAVIGCIRRIVGQAGDRSSRSNAVSTAAVHDAAGDVRVLPCAYRRSTGQIHYELRSVGSTMDRIGSCWGRSRWKTRISLSTQLIRRLEWYADEEVSGEDCFRFRIGAADCEGRAFTRGPVEEGLAIGGKGMGVRGLGV